MSDENKSKPEIHAEIAQSFPAVINEAATNRSWTALLDDYCAIGALLTDHKTCLAHLKSLNDDMASELKKQLEAHAAEQRNQFWVGRPLAQFGQLDAVRIGRFMGNTRDQAADADLGMLPKFYGVLQRVLQREENRFGFNSMKNELPVELTGKAKKGQTPTLTGFFHPESFTEVLLKQGFHWKDPGAGIAHGEFTHRIQWYIIQQASFLGPYKTANSVLRIYQSLALPQCFGADTWTDTKTAANVIASRLVNKPAVFGKRTVWDLLVDCITQSSKAYGPRSDTYRCPEKLNFALMNKSGNDQWIRNELPVLSNYLLARNTKRSFYEMRDRMGDQFDAMKRAIDGIPGGTRYDAFPGKQESDADGRAVWRRDR